MPRTHIDTKISFPAIQFVKGNSLRIVLRFYSDKNKTTPLPLPSSTWTAAVVQKLGDAQDIATLTVDTSGVSSGQLVLEMSAATSANLPEECYLYVRIVHAGKTRIIGWSRLIVEEVKV